MAEELVDASVTSVASELTGICNDLVKGMFEKEMTPA
jgi:hypothetical protein